jgi:hypothetical protein
MRNRNLPTGLQPRVDVTHQIGVDRREAIFSRGLHAESGEINDGGRVRTLPPTPDRETRHDVIVRHNAKDKICSCSAESARQREIDSLA